MWSNVARPDSHEPGETEIGLTVAAAYEAGDAIDAIDSALRCADIYGDLNRYYLAAARTDADAEELFLSFEAGVAASASSAEVVDLAARRRRAPATRTGLRAA